MCAKEIPHTDIFEAPANAMSSPSGHKNCPSSPGFQGFLYRDSLLVFHCLSRWPSWAKLLYVHSRAVQLLLLNDSIQLRQSTHASLAPENPLVPHIATMPSFPVWLSKQLARQSPWPFNFSDKGQVPAPSALSTSAVPNTRYLCSFQIPLPWCKVRGKFPPP